MEMWKGAQLLIIQKISGLYSWKWTPNSEVNVSHILMTNMHMNKNFSISCKVMLFIIRDWSISIGGVGWSTEGVGHYGFSLPNGVGHAIFTPGRGGSSYFQPCILKYCKLQKPSVSPAGGGKSLQNLHKTCRKRSIEQKESYYKLNFGSLHFLC